MTEREVGVSPGRTAYDEVIVRTVYTDETVSDSEPESFEPGTPYEKIKARMMPRSIVRITDDRIKERYLFGRTVLIEASPWSPLATEQSPASTPEPSPAEYKVRDYCKRLTCGHHHEKHGERDDQGDLVQAPTSSLSAVAIDSHGGMCTVCGNAEQCRSFVAGPAS